MEPGFKVMADWMQGLDGYHRAKVLAELPAWLGDDHSWHSRAVMEIALRLSDPAILEAAVREAARKGVRDLDEVPEYPPWLLYHLNLLSTISRWPGDVGGDARRYLQDLRHECSGAAYSRRLLGIRAWFTECLIDPDEDRMRCLNDGVSTLRGWRNAKLLRSGLLLLHAYFASTPKAVDGLREVLTAAEFATAFPEASRNP
jgi:hypothetical protein